MSRRRVALRSPFGGAQDERKGVLFDPLMLGREHMSSPLMLRPPRSIGPQTIPLMLRLSKHGPRRNPRSPFECLRASGKGRCAHTPPLTLGLSYNPAHAEALEA